MADATRSLTDLFGILGERRETVATARPDSSVTNVAEAAFPTKALHKFLASLQALEGPLLLDLGPVVGSNVTFFGEQLGCRLRVEDVAKDIDRHTKEGTLDQLPDYFTKRFTQPAGTVDGILCWDMIDYLDRRAAQALAGQLTRVLRPDGALLAFFGTAQPRETRYTKYIIVDEVNLKYRTYTAARGRQAALLNRDIIKLFSGLRVSDSFLLKNNLREILFRKPS